MIHTHSLGRAARYHASATALVSGAARPTFKELHARHSSLPAPPLRLPWERVLDVEPLELRGGDCPAAIYDPEAILALIYTSGTTGRPKGVAVTHAALLANVDHINYWMPYTEGGVYLHAAPLFHIDSSNGRGRLCLK